MGYQHGRRTEITVGGGDISADTKNSEITRSGDAHRVEGYGAEGHEYGDDGLFSGEFVCDGTYNNTAMTGSRAILRSKHKTLVVITRKPEGTGSGKPLETFTAFFEEYKESNPVVDYIKWSAKFKISGVIADTNQS